MNRSKSKGSAALKAQIAELQAQVDGLRHENELLGREAAALRAALAAAAGGRADDTHLEAVRYLVMAAEYKDHDTGAHLVRIGYFSALLAPRCGCSEECARLLLMAGPMHDVGKIGIPDRILKKQGALSPAERHVMQRHPEYGSRILGGSEAPVLKLASEIALNHHEHFDGRGYPRRLKGEQIPLPARIVAVVDTFDALVMDRSYRAALAPERALEMVEAGRGGQFDPDVVDAFFEVVDRMLEMRDGIARGEPPADIPGLPAGAAQALLGFYDAPLHSVPPDGSPPDERDYYYR